MSLEWPYWIAPSGYTPKKYLVEGSQVSPYYTLQKVKGDKKILLVKIRSHCKEKKKHYKRILSLKL